MLRELRQYLNTTNHFLQSRYRRSDWELPLLDQGEIGPVEEDKLDAILSQYDDDVVFVHAGLSDIKSAFGGNPYEFLVRKLDEHFESVLVPGFTPSFRAAGIYHKQFSRPEYGALSRLFLDDADYRTADPIHSIQVKGEYRFEDCDHRESFSERSCYGKLDDDDVLYLNVGTPWIVSTQIHHVEYIADTPYVEETSYDGTVYHDETNYESVTQQHYTAPPTMKWNRSKIENALASNGVLARHDLNGLSVRLFRANGLRRTLEPRIERDPYYLVT